MNIETYRSLFVHRDDVFAIQSEKGHYRPAGRGHFEDDGYGVFVYDEYFPLTDDDIEEHLAGQWSIGAYVIDPEHNSIDTYEYTVSFIVFDLDTYDEQALRFLCEEVEALVLGAAPNATPLAARCLLLENSGGKGFHVWLFLSEPVTAARARAFAEPVRTAYNLEAHHHNGNDEHTLWPALEIFPKQDAVDEGGFGNLVKLPLGVHAKTGRRSEFVVIQGWANSVDNVQRLDASLIPQVAAAPPRQGAARGEGGLRQAPFACIARIHDEGAPSGCRDNAMVHLAHYCFGTGVMDYEQVLDTCLNANSLFDPPLTSTVVAQKVRSAMRLQAAHPSCRADWLRDFCPGGESCYAPWNVRADDSERSTTTDDDYARLSPEERRLRRLGTVGE